MKKPRPIKAIGRMRRAAGWTLLALGLLVAGVWVASGWWTVGYRDNGWGTSVDHGRIDVWWRATYVNYGFTQEFYDSQSVLPGQWYIYPQRWKDECIIWTAECYVDRHSIVIDSLNAGLVSLSFVTHESFAQRELIAPFWPLPLVLWTTGGLVIWSGRRARRRAMTNHCSTCGYNLAGLGAEAPCPECGKAKGAIDPLASGSLQPAAARKG